VKRAQLKNVLRASERILIEMIEVIAMIVVSEIGIETVIVGVTVIVDAMGNTVKIAVVEQFLPTLNS
jgi:hypothetical protein